MTTRQTTLIKFGFPKVQTTLKLFKLKGGDFT